MLKAIIFDIDGVLADSLVANTKYVGDFLHTAGYKRPSRAEIHQIFHMHLKDVIKVLTKSKSKKELERVQQIASETEYPEHLLKTTKEVRDVVKKLHSKYTLGLVTSRMRRTTGSYFKVSGLKKYFKVAVSYEDTKNHKPHPDPLLFAVRKLKIKPSDAVYIGDMPSDVASAKSAGMKVIIYSKKFIKGADAQTKSFKEIPIIINLLS